VRNVRCGVQHTRNFCRWLEHHRVPHRQLLARHRVLRYRATTYHVHQLEIRGRRQVGRILPLPGTTRTHEQTDGRTKSKHNAFAAHLTLMVGRQKSIQRSNVQSFKDPKIWLLTPTPFAGKPVSTSYLTGSFTPSVSPLGTTGLPAHFITDYGAIVHALCSCHDQSVHKIC